MKIIISEKQHKSLRLRRNLEKLPKYISSAYGWLNPHAFNNFDEFLERVIFSASRDFAAEFLGEGEDYQSTWESITPFVRDMVMNRFYDKILDYFNSHINN